MKLLDTIIGLVGNTSRDPLGELVRDMPPDVQQDVCDAIGTDKWNAFLKTAQEGDPEVQAAMLAALLGQMTGAEKEKLGKAIPKEWQERMEAAFKAVLARGAQAA